MWHYLYKRRHTAVAWSFSLFFTHAEMANTAWRCRSPLLLQLRQVGDGDQLQKGTAQDAKRQHRASHH